MLTFFHVLCLVLLSSIVLWIIPGFKDYTRKAMRENRLNAAAGITYVFAPYLIDTFIIKQGQGHPLQMTLILVTLALMLFLVFRNTLTASSSYLKWILRIALLLVLFVDYPFKDHGFTFFGILYRHEYFILGILAVVSSTPKAFAPSLKPTTFSASSVASLLALGLGLHFLVSEFSGYFAETSAGTLSIPGLSYQIAFFSVFYLLICKFIILEPLQSFLVSVPQVIIAFISFWLFFGLLYVLTDFNQPGINYYITLVAQISLLMAGTTGIAVPWICYTAILLISSLGFGLHLI